MSEVVHSSIHCSTCVLPSTFPNITFNEQGVCNFCLQPEPAHQQSFDERQREEFERIVGSIKGKFPYDALCCYSGGKDSTYMLKMMVRTLGLKVLAFTLDNGFITEQSKQNIIKVVDILHVDHLFFKPSRQFMSQMYKQAIFGDLNKGRGNYARISDICLSCISVVNTHAARLAMQNRIPMIFAGFTPGQIPRAVIKNNYRYYRDTFAQQRDHFHERLGADCGRYLDLPDGDSEIYQMSPYLVYEKSEAFILAEIRDLGWEYPQQLDGCTSNCASNVVGNMCHEKKYGFHPYALELSKLVRKGLLSRDEGVQKLSQSVEDQVIEQTLLKLDLTPRDLQRLQKRGA